MIHENEIVMLILGLGVFIFILETRHESNAFSTRHC